MYRAFSGKFSLSLLKLVNTSLLYLSHSIFSLASSDGDETPDPTIPPFVLDDSTFKVRTNPIIDTGVNNLKLQLAMRSRNVFSTNQDRTHVFYMHKRPGNVATKTIHNLNVRGKRGNIVQTFPANEYDFFPTDLKIKQDELVHIQWTGKSFKRILQYVVVPLQLEIYLILLN